MKKITLVLAGLSLLVSTLAAEVNIKACSGCHGTDWSKAALGKSGIVKDMNATAITTALKGYKAGTLNKYGMGSLMKGQVAKYSDTELEAAALKISSK